MMEILEKNSSFYNLLKLCKSCEAAHLTTIKSAEKLTNKTESTLKNPMSRSLSTMNP